MAHLAEARVGDVGIELQFQMLDADDQGIDVTVATVRRIYMIKPDGTVVEKAATAGTVADPSSGTSGFIHCITADGEIDQRGVWFFEAYVEVGSKKLTSGPDSFLVESPKRSS